jgi:YidC/Oxa1 family membrane protein insertase
MEKKLILAIVLSFAILFLYQLIFVKKAAEPQTRVEQIAKTEQGQTPPPPEKKLTESAAVVQETKPVPKPQNTQQISAPSEQQISVSSSLYQAVWSNKGGVLVNWKLRQHKNEKNEDLELVPARAKDVGVYPFALMDEAQGINDFGVIKSNIYNSALYKVTGQSLVLKDGQKGEIDFIYSDGKGIEIEKAFTFYGGKYDLDISINIKKNGQKIEPRLLWGPGIGNPSEKDLKQSFGAGGGVTAFDSNNINRMEEIKFRPGKKEFKGRNLEEALSYAESRDGFNIPRSELYYEVVTQEEGKEFSIRAWPRIEAISFPLVNWAGYDDNYFTALFVPPIGKGNAVFLRIDEEKGSNFFLSISNPKQAFIGPKEYDILVAFGHNAKKSVRFGFLGFIAEILLYAIKFIHKFIPNWGFAIIVLTILIKILFFPLTYSSTKSMSKMAELQPKVKALRAKYKKAKQDIAQRRQMNEEMMKLYKEHGVNPAGGCLPMLIQIPVFIGFFNLLRIAIEMRRSPWILWITDLSVKDPYYVTPILMGMTQFISQKMTPTSADPSQAKMMLIMPVIMTIFFMNFQSGLVLYWLTSNVLQIGQQYIMNRMMKKKKSENHGKRRKN